MKMTFKHKIIKFTLLICISVFSATNSNAIDPKRKYEATPAAIGIKFEIHKIKINDSITLNSWACLQPVKNRPFLIISGSDAGNMAYSLGQTKALYDAGYNIILYDYRGFGESSDFKMDRNMVYYNEFAEDLKLTIQYVKKTFKPKSVILYGMSMGTIVSRINLDNDKIIKGMILDSFVIDPKLLAERILALKNRVLILPNGAIAYVKSNQIKLKKPILLFSGLKDMVTKTVDYKSFLIANPTARMITWDCNHLECFTSMGDDPNLYIVEVTNFIKKL